MARGNDAEAAERELRARLGGRELNAEKIIQANADRWSTELRAANGKKVDTDATEALDEGALARKVDGEVLGFAVRGKHVVVVHELDDGEVVKEAIALDDLGRAGDKAEKATQHADAKTLAAEGRVPDPSTPRK